LSLEAAIEFALRAHAGQVDRAGEPYILHPLRVMVNVEPRYRRVAVLHDVVEDTAVDFEWVTADLGLEEWETHALYLLTRSEGIIYSHYIDRIRTADGPEGAAARVVKLADLNDNMTRGALGAGHLDRYIKAQETLSA
jgi:hypothetical protein